MSKRKGRVDFWFPPRIAKNLPRYEFISSPAPLLAILWGTRGPQACGLSPHRALAPGQDGAHRCGQTGRCPPTPGDGSAGGPQGSFFGNFLNILSHVCYPPPAPEFYFERFHVYFYTWISLPAPHLCVILDTLWTALRPRLSFLPWLSGSGLTLGQTTWGGRGGPGSLSFLPPFLKNEYTHFILLFF